MESRLAYLLMVVLAGWSVTFGLRALPFLLFAGRDRTLPPWVERFGNLVSPVIIGGLIVYSYSGLEWRAVWPYLAGLLTVGLQIWRRNPLVSIVAGTALYMALVAGCTTQQISVDVDARNPSIRVAECGILFGETSVESARVPAILSCAGIPRDRTIHIRVDRSVRDLKCANLLLLELRRAGYTGGVLVTERHAESFVTKKADRMKDASGTKTAEPPKKIHYKKANE